MRLVLVLILWAAIIGGVTLYMEHRGGRAVSAVSLSAPELADRHFILEVTATFDAEPDPFALRTDGSAGAGIVVRRGGEEILRSDTLRAGEPVTVPVEGLRAGVNEFVFEAAPPSGEVGRAAGLRLRLLEGLSVVADRTYWAEGGAVVAGTFRPELAASGAVANEISGKEADHE